MSTIYCIMVRRDEVRTIKDCKVIPGECRNTAPTDSDGNECRDDKEAKTAYQTTANEMAEPREGRVQTNMSTKRTRNTSVCYTRNEL